jgi:hypothetical protein
MRRLAVVLVLVVAGCGGNGGGSAATTSTTSTTLADPAATACRQFDFDVKDRKADPALDQLTLSRDPRIVDAATQVESIVRDRELDANAVPPDLDLEYAEAVLELARACKVAGYLP